MERRKKALICFFLLVSLIFPRVKIVKAEALPVEVMEETATIADIVMSYYAVSGNAIANTNYINTLYNELGTNFGTIEELAQQGLLVLNETTGNWESTAGLATAIENTSVYASLGLNDIFNVSAQEAAELGSGAVAATGGTILANAAAGVASIGTVPLIGGVSAAYWAGIGIGTLISHQIDKYIENIATGSAIDETVSPSLLENQYVGGVNSTFVSRYNSRFAYSFQSGIILGYYVASDEYHFYACNTTNDTLYHKDFEPGGLSNPNPAALAANSYTQIRSASYAQYVNWGIKFADGAALQQAFNNWKTGVGAPIQRTQSPDMIGENGNLYAQRNGEGDFIVPDFKPQIDTGTESGKPLRLQDWLNFANAVKNNNSSVTPLPDNSSLFDDLLDAIRDLIPVNPNPNPNPNPDPGGQTRPVPTPTPVPDPDYDVPQPEQPEWQSETTQQTEEVPDSIPTGKPWVVEGLQNKFPFCIPWDIKNMLGKFSSASRQAPYISWRFNPPFTPIDYTFQVDLADFEDAAAILRTLELIAFIVGLAFATRYLIGAT